MGVQPPQVAPETTAEHPGWSAGSGFVHLHLHTEYSLLDGGNRIDRLVKRVKELGMPAVGVTDHGNIFGAATFYQAARDAGIKPILGVEAYVTPPGKPRTDRTYTGGGEGGYHLVLLAENNTGWQNLLHLCSEAFLTGFYYKPRIDRELLAKHAEGLIAINGHLGSEIGEHLLSFERTGDEKYWELAKESAQWHAAAFGGEARSHEGTKPRSGAASDPSCLRASVPACLPRFYVELQHHVDEQNAINKWLIKLARELGLPLVGDNDAHFLRAEDHDAHDTLICISTGKAKSDPDRMRYTPELYVKSPEQMRSIFARYNASSGEPDVLALGEAGTEALDNTLAIARRCNVELPLGKNNAPAVRVARRRSAETERRRDEEKTAAGKRGSASTASSLRNSVSGSPVSGPLDEWSNLPRWDEPRFAGDLTAWYQAYCAEFDVVPLRIPEGASDEERKAIAAEAKAECDAALRRLAEAGFVWRYGPGERDEETKRTRDEGAKGSDASASSLRNSVSTSPGERRDRLNRELTILADKGISAYFLIVWDFVNWGRSSGVPGLARGSGVGTMVGYALGLSNACPVKYGLLFERFTDPDRSEYPDIDIDLCQDGRQRVIDYVRQKYGHVAQIITFGTLKARAAIRDAGRVMEMTPAEVDQIAKLVPEQLNITIEEALEKEPDLKKLYERDERVARVIDSAKVLEGQVRHAGVHAAGVIVATRPLSEIVPLYRQSGSEAHEIVTQWDGPTCEKFGLLKMDFLGLRTISIVERCKKLIREGLGERDIWAAVGREREFEETKRRREALLSGAADSVSSELRLSVSHPLDLDRLTFDDQRVFELFRRGETTGVFQFESPGMRRLLVEMKPDRLEDLIAANALFRPGPMDLIPDYNRRKHGTEDVPRVHDVVDRYTRETYGVMVYQEQVMQIVHGLGGIKLRDAYTLIKNISKKKHDKIEKERPKFVDGAQKQGLSKKQAEDLFELILKFAGYGFNKSHSTGYAIVAYQTAYLKTYFPNQYMAAFLTYESQAQKAADWIPYLEDCKKTRFIDPATGTTVKVGVEVRPPDVNLSQAEFAVVFEEDRHSASGIGHSTGAKNAPTNAESRMPNAPLRSHAGHVRFGLKGIKGTGDKAIDAILRERHGGTEARRHEGHDNEPANAESRTSNASADSSSSVPPCLRASVPFSSLFDFTERIVARAPGVLNKGTMEALIVSGAMDCLHGRPKRAAMMATIEQALSAGAKAAADKASGQGALFGLVPAAVATKPAEIPLAPVAPWTESETLAKERDVMGFYVSSHPMEVWRPWAGCFANAACASLGARQQDQRVIMAGLIQGVRSLVVKSGRSAGQKMAVVTLEDPTGTGEIVVFSDQYAKFGHLLEPDKILFVLGRVDLSRGTPQVVAERLVPIEGVPVLPGRVRITVPGVKLNGSGVAAVEQVARLLLASSPQVAANQLAIGQQGAQVEPKPDGVLATISPAAAGPVVSSTTGSLPPGVPVVGVVTGKGASVEATWPVELVIETAAGRALLGVDPRLKIRLTPELVKGLAHILGPGSARVVAPVIAEAVEPKAARPWERKRREE